MRFFLTEEAKKAGVLGPSRAYERDAGIDLRAALPARIEPGEWAEIPTGAGFEMSDEHFGLICNRTSSARRGLLPLGHVVDAGYRGEIILILLNLSRDRAVEIGANERVAQMVMMPLIRFDLEEAAREDVSASMRGDRRFGSSGIL